MISVISSCWLNASFFAKSIIITLVSLTVLLPGIFTGFMGDDLLHYLFIQHSGLIPDVDDYSLFNLFSFVDTSNDKRQQLMAISLLPWWTGKDFSWNFWRPLSELSLFIDYRFYPSQPWIMHLHSLAVFALLLLVACWLYRIIFSKICAEKNSVSLWAFAFFALGLSHTITVVWLSNRHALIASIFIVLSVIFYHKFFHFDKRISGWVVYSLSLLFAILAFLSSELGVCVGVWLFVYTVIKKPIISFKKYVYLLPFLFIFLIWAWVYQKGGFGVQGYSSFYIDPIENPVGFIKQYITNIPVIIFSQVFSIPADVLNVPGLPWLIPSVGWLMLAIIFYCLRTNKYKEAAFGLLAITFLLIAPISTSPAQDRNLLQVSLAFSGVLALLTAQGLAWIKVNKNYWVKSLLGFVLVMHLIVSPLLTIPLSFLPVWLSAGKQQRAASLSIDEGDDVFVFKGDMMEMIYLYPRLVVNRQPLPDKLWNLGGNGSMLDIKKINDHTLLVMAISSFFSAGDLMARNPALEPFTDKVIDLGGVEVEVQTVDKNGYPKKIELRFIKSIENIRFFVWEKSRFKPLPFSGVSEYQLLR